MDGKSFWWRVLWDYQLRVIVWKMWSSVFGALVFCGLIHYGLPIMCYECNSAINSQCSEKVPPDSLKRNCSDHDRGVTHTLCRKIIQHVDYGVNGKIPESRVVRSCGWDDTKYKGRCYHRAGYGGRQEVCSCTTDFCNSGHQDTFVSHLLISTTLMAVLHKIFE